MKVGIVLLSHDGYYLSHDGRLPIRPNNDKHVLLTMVQDKVVLCSENTLESLPQSIIDAAADVTTDIEADWDVNFGIATFRDAPPDIMFIRKTRRNMYSGNLFSYKDIFDGYSLMFLGQDNEGVFETWLKNPKTKETSLEPSMTSSESQAGTDSTQDQENPEPPVEENPEPPVEENPEPPVEENTESTTSTLIQEEPSTMEQTEQSVTPSSTTDTSQSEQKTSSEESSDGTEAATPKSTTKASQSASSRKSSTSSKKRGNQKIKLTR